MKKWITIISILVLLPIILVFLYRYFSLKDIESVVYDEPMCEGGFSCATCLKLLEEGNWITCSMVYEGGYTYNDCKEYQKEEPNIHCYTSY